MYSASKFTDALKSEARRLGFDLAGACSAVNATGFQALVDWLAAGYAGEMAYLERRIDAYRNPNGVMPGTVSLLLVGLNYRTVEPIQGEPGTGRISRYAWSQTDYHDLIRSRLKLLETFANDSLIELGHADARVRGVVDTAPLLEREFAQLAGLGWQGKNTMLIRPQFGSWFFLAGLLLSVELDYDQPFTANHCGTCTACLDHCPTQAFPQPGVLDATRCISYLTIEHRSPIDRTLRHKMNDWILGCDVCQEVCPWNRKGASSSEPAFLPTHDQNPISLRELFFLTDDEFRKRFSKTPLWRPKRRGILRNAAIALGNRPHAGNLIALKQGLVDPEPLVRGASAWALGQHRFPISFEALVERLQAETDSMVTDEIKCALDSMRFD